MLPFQLPVQRMTVAGVETSITSTAERSSGTLFSRMAITASAMRCFSD